MKIFNWMHRKLLPSLNYSQVSQTDDPDIFGGEHEEKCEVAFESVMEKEALIFHDVLNSILTIGTLGHEDYFISQPYSMQEAILLEKEEENVVIETTDKRNAVFPTLLLNEPLPLSESFRFKLPVEEESKKMEMVMHDAEKTEMNEELPLLTEEKEKSTPRRITLADLLAADAIAMNDQSENANKETDGKFKQPFNTHDRKKMLKNKKEEKWALTTTKAKTSSSSSSSSTTTTTTTTTTRRLKKLITKVLKKKVHPAMGLAPNADGIHPK